MVTAEIKRSSEMPVSTDRLPVGDAAVRDALTQARKEIFEKIGKLMELEPLDVQEIDYLLLEDNSLSQLSVTDQVDHLVPEICRFQKLNAAFTDAREKFGDLATKQAVHTLTCYFSEEHGGSPLKIKEFLDAHTALLYRLDDQDLQRLCRGLRQIFNENRR